MGRGEGFPCRQWGPGSLLESGGPEARRAQDPGICMPRKKMEEAPRTQATGAALPHPPSPLTAPHSLQWCFLLVMELKVSPQPLQPCFSLSRLVLEDPLLGSSYRKQMVAVSFSARWGGDCVIHRQCTHRAKSWMWTRESSGSPVGHGLPSPAPQGPPCCHME